MVSLLSTTWLGYLKLKHRLFGLMPLQGLVNKYHHKDKQEHNPLWTYWLFLTYEAEVTEAIKKARERGIETYRSRLSDTPEAENPVDAYKVADAAEEAAYLGISAGLRAPENSANHNIKKKVFLHLLGLVVVSFLMVGIAASNTMSLTGFLSENGIVFGAYTNIVTGTFYVSAVWAQWMIFRRGVTKMLKSLFSWSNGGSDFFETAELELARDINDHHYLRFKRESEGGIKNSHLPGYASRRRRSFIYGLCTAACAMAWGVLVYTKLSDGLSSADGFFAISSTLAGNWGLVFGSLAGFAACFLWLTALRTELKNEERDERKAMLRIKSGTGRDSVKNLNNNDTNKSLVLRALIAATLYALLASMLGQARIVFETLGWENANENPLDPRHPKGLLYFGVFVSAIFIGRMRFSVSAMETFYENVKRTWEASTIDKIRNEISCYRANYVMGCVTILVLVGFFAASLQYDILRKPMTAGSNGHRILSPMGIMTIGALFVWTLFLVLKRLSDGRPEEADEKEAAREAKTSWFPSGSIKKGYEDRTGNALVAAAFNGMAFGGIGGKGIQGTVEDIGEATVPDNAETAKWVSPTAVSTAAVGQVTLGLQSFTTSTQARGLIQVERKRADQSPKAARTG